MKRKLRRIVKVMLVISTFTLILTTFALIYPTGSPGGKTGSPFDASNCTSCHGGTPMTKAGLITSNIPVAGYTGGTTYTITVSVSGSTSNKKGFEVSPQNSSGAVVGTLTPGTNSQLTNSNKSVTHSVALMTNPAVWTFQWTAPIAGTGSVTFYGAFADSKDSTFLSTLTIPEKPGTSINETSPVAFSCTSNPVNGRMEINFNLDKKSNVTINVFSLNGKKIMQLMSEVLVEGNHKVNFNLENNLIPGIYLLNLNIAGKSFVRKFTISG